MLPGKYVYHGAPETLVGGRLVSLFALEALDPVAFREAIAKYGGREGAPYVRIPGTDLRFNDTIHCAPIHPWYVRQARRDAGIDPGPAAAASAGRRFFRIPIASFGDDPVIWYRGRTLWVNGAPGADVPLEPPPEEFEPFDAGRYRELTAVPPEYGLRIREALEAGRRPLMFVTIPHVLVAGRIDLAESTEIDPDEPPPWER